MGEKRTLLVVGLGNPGKRYRNTRHNVGFDFVEAFSVRTGVALTRRWPRRYRLLRWENEQVRLILCQPLTFMNDSGRILPALMRRCGVRTEDVVIVVDNMDLPPGEVRMKSRGGRATHNGLRSVSRHLGSDEYARVYLGVGRPALHASVIDHVLGPFASSDRSAVDQAMSRTVDLFLTTGGDRSQLISAVNARRRA